MQTIFITCFNGFIARNILASEAFTLLTQRPDLRVVIFAPEERAGAIRQEFGGERVTIEGISAGAKEIQDPVERFFFAAATNLLATGTRSIQRRVKLSNDGRRAEYFLSLAAGALGRLKIVRNLFRMLAFRAVPGREYEPYVQRHRPRLLFATDIYTPYDAKFLRLARRRGIPAVGMVRSWDNVTSKTLLTVIPERVIVQSEYIRAELIRYGDVPAERIVVSGVPLYDRYRREARTPRPEFCRKLGLDPAKRIILFIPPSDVYLKHDPITPLILETLSKLNTQVLVRLPLVGRAEFGGYRPGPKVVFDAPEGAADFTALYLNPATDRHLADSIFQAAVVVTWASTTIIDAAVFNRPVVLVGFDAAPRRYTESITRYYDYDHQKRILELGGARLAKSPEELASWVGRYLADPELDRAGRDRIVAQYCGALDGQAGARIASVLLKELA